MKQCVGISFLELLITLTIIGVLSTLSFSIYSQHFIVQKRLEAVIYLTKLAAALEEYYLSENSYQNATVTSLGLPSTIAQGQYRLIIAKATAYDYALKAIPLQNQAKKDTLCGTLSLTSSGKKQISGKGDLADCW